MNRFEQKTVLVTGGTSGIGLAAAQAFAAEGARVIVTGRDAAALETTRATLGARAVAIQNTAGAPGAAAALADALQTAGIRLDAVFVNAGIAKFATLADATEDLWDQTFNTNIKGVFFQLQALDPLLNPGASIVLNGSINAHIGMPASSIYAASKAALISLAKTLSAELLPRGIRVNVVSPARSLPPSTASWAWTPRPWKRPQPASRRRFRWAVSARRRNWRPPCCTWPRRSPPSSWAPRSSWTAG